jgi:hypothetical protein
MNIKSGIEIYKFFDNPGHRDKQKLKDGYSYVKTPGAVAVYSEGPKKSSHKWHNNGPNVPNTMTRSKGHGGFTIYKEGPAPAAPKPAPKPAPPPPKPQPKPPEPIKYSPEIEQAKDRVNAYENSKSPWEQAQATVQSSFIKDTGSSPNNQYDFSGNTFEAKESAKPNKQEQAALNQMQNYISKYSSHT